MFAVDSGMRPTDAAGSAIETKAMEALNYTTKEINRNFKIRVSGIYEGKEIKTLVGVTGLVKYVGDIALTNRLLDRAFNSMDDKCVCKLRRGIQIRFYWN